MKGLRCAGEDVDGAPVGDRVDAVVAGDAEQALPEVEAVVAAPSAGGPSAAFLGMVPHDYARRHLLLALDDGTLLRAATTPPLVVFNITSRLGQAGVAVEREQLVAVDELAARIDEAYARQLAAQSGDPPGAAGEAESDRPVTLVEDSGEDVELAVAATIVSSTILPDGLTPLTINGRSASDIIVPQMRTIPPCPDECRLTHHGPREMLCLDSPHRGVRPPGRQTARRALPAPALGP